MGKIWQRKKNYARAGQVDDQRWKIDCKDRNGATKGTVSGVSEVFHAFCSVKSKFENAICQSQMFWGVNGWLIKIGSACFGNVIFHPKISTCHRKHLQNRRKFWTFGHPNSHNPKSENFLFSIFRGYQKFFHIHRPPDGRKNAYFMASVHHLWDALHPRLCLQKKVQAGPIQKFLKSDP